MDGSEDFIVIDNDNESETSEHYDNGDSSVGSDSER
jgi:hypothetical protein